MNKDEYNKLKESGWSGVLVHYGKALLGKRITSQQYDQAIKYWSKEFNKKVSKSPSGIQKAETQPSDKESNEPPKDAVERLVKDCGKMGIELKDTKEDITH